jgi:hypothetical protein
MKKIILHVGAGKTGSSALQKYLSMLVDPLMAGGTRYEYCAVDSVGNILRQAGVREKSKQEIMGYCASTQDLSTISYFQFDVGLKQLEQAGVVPIFSQENWLTHPFQAKSLQCLEAADEIEIIAYLRPQTEWFNSCWWQWLAWDSRVESPEAVLDLWPDRIMHWGHYLEAWSRVPRVTKIHARLQRHDIVADILSLLRVRADHLAETVNSSMGENMIRLYRSLPGLRTPLGAELDVVIARHIEDAGATPWIVKPLLVKRIISETRETNELLLTFLDDAQQKEMTADRRWWDQSAFAERRLTSLDQLQMDPREAAQLLAQIIVRSCR